MSAYPAVVRVFSKREAIEAHFKGTAFFVTERELLTCAHVVDACGGTVFLQIGSECWPAETVQTAAGVDLAWLRLQVAQTVPPLWLDTALPPGNSPMGLLGFDGCENQQIQRHSTVASHHPALNLLVLSHTLACGMSGGPALNEAQRVVGVILARDADKNVAYAIPASAAFKAFPGLQTALAEALPWSPDQAPLLKQTQKLFVKREPQLEQLKAALLPADGAALQPVAVTALHGMAGVGKSWLVRHFAQRHRAWFQGGYLVLDLNPESPPSLSQAVDRLADSLSLGGPRQLLAAAVAWELRWRKVLLHLENADSEAAVALAAELAGLLEGCVLVVAGRIERMGLDGGWRRVPVKPFDTEDGVAQLRAELEQRQVTPPADADMRALVNALGGLPLAIHLAGASLAYEGITVTSYLAELRRCGLSLMQPVDPADPRLARESARSVVASSFALSLRLLRQRLGSDAALQSLAALTLAPSDGVHEHLANALMGDPPQGRQWRAAAVNHGLLQQTAAAETAGASATEPPVVRWSMHPLVAEHWRTELPDPDAAQNRLTDWFVGQLQQDGMAGAHQEFAALGDWLLGQVPEARWVEVERVGSRVAHLIGPFHAWAGLCRRVLTLLDVGVAEQSNALFTLAMVTRMAGDLDGSLEAAWRKREVDLRRGEDREAAIAMGQIADILEARGDLDEALRIRKDEQLPVLERLGDVREVAITKGKIADIVQARGDLDEALRIRKDEELPVYERLGDVRSVAITKGQIADIVQARGDLDEALRIRKDEELPVLERLGDVRSVLVARANLAQMFWKKDRVAHADEARRLLELALIDAQRLRLPEVAQILDLQAAMGFLPMLADGAPAPG